MPRPVVPTEHQEQSALVRWASLHDHPALRNLIAVPNGGKRNLVTAKLMKAEGVRPGVPDLFLAWPRAGSAGLWIELKRRKGGTVSPEQVDWIRRLKECGYEARVCRGWDEARKAICSYLGILE